MNRKKVNGAKKSESSFIKRENDCHSNSTDSFDMNDFKSSSLNQRYSVQVHKNKADLMAELSNINIMGDESDAECAEPRAQQNGVRGCASVSDVNSSKMNSMNSSGATDGRSNGDFENEKQERILAWAQSQSQNLSMCVASILSDHDYLSQQSLLGLVSGNEENNELENSQREINGNVTSNQDNGEVTQNGGLDPMRVDGAGDAGKTSADADTNKSDMDDLNAILKKLMASKEKEQRLSLLDEIQQKTKSLKEQLGGNEVNDKTDNTEQKNETPEFSANHSEPLEYNDTMPFSTDSSSDPAKESEGDGELHEIKKELKTVKSMANRISIDITTMFGDLSEIQKKPETERSMAIDDLRKNVGLLVDDIAKGLTKIAIKFHPELVPTKAEAATQKTPDKRRTSQRSSDSTDDNSDSFERKSRKLKKRRKVPKNHSDISDSMHVSSDSIDSDADKDKAVDDVKKEPFIVSQNLDDLINGTGSNSANESIRKENDFLGFENVDDFDVGIKREVMLNSESMLSSQSANEKNSSSKAMDVSKDTSDDESTEIINYDEKPAKSNDSAIKETDLSSDAASLNDADIDHIEDDDDDDDDGDDDIRKLLDLSTLEAKRITSTHAAAKVNGVVELKKPVKKASKSDELSKFLANSEEGTEPQAESDEEKSDREEFTEEQFLKERNLMLKEQLLQDSSDSEQNESDSDDRINGGSGYNSDVSSHSNQSLVGKFLESESRSSGGATPIVKTPEKPKESKVAAEKQSEKKLQSKEKESPPKRRETDKMDSIDHEMDSDIEFGSESGSVSFSDAPRKSKSTVGKNAFASIDKDIGILIASDDEEMSGNDDASVKSKKTKPIREKSEADSSAILDTSMFKSNKKDYTAQQLQRLFNHKKQTDKSRQSPECISVSSGEDSEIESTSVEKKDGNDDDEDGKKRVKRRLLRDDQLADDTKLAQKEESDRIKRLDKKNERLTQFTQSQRESQEDDPESQIDIDPNEVMLDIDSKKNERIMVHREITKHLKAHQVEGIKFMYDCCYGSVDTLDKYPGSGCILAHCMGLGKTLQLITLLHTVISYPQLKTDKVLVICPKSTVMNWKEEIERWLSPIKNTRRLKLFYFPESSDINSKIQTLREWSRCGKDNKQAGCLLLGYEAFRVLVFYHNSKKSQSMYSKDQLEKLRENIHKYLLDPGADLVVCDEGHMIKNQKSTTSLAVNKIETRRRIVLTGTPIQNNLKEYYSMVNFIKPSFLGTEKEFANLYVNPIKNGQHKDSSKGEIKHMKQRSYVLHKKLSRFVQRKEAALLKSFLPHKYEFVLFIPMTDIQTKLYEFFLENRPNQDQKGKSLIPDYTVLRKIWTHPKVLENAYLNAIHNKTKMKPIAPTTAANDSDDDQPDDVFDSQTGSMSVTSDWWRTHLTTQDLETILPSNKLKILFEILNQCRRNKEKCLIFSAFVAVLDVVEFFMRLIDSQEKQGNKEGLETFRGPWELGKDYYRLDGKTAKHQRHSMITNFNDPKNDRIRVFLISAKAGGQGINLIGANRVVLLDTSWNPSNDQQNIFRVFRLGQKKICYIYRLLSMGTMEEKVYSRSVTKQAMSCRVVDEQQIDRHYNMTDLTDLYTLTKPDMEKRPIPNVPKDDVLAYLLIKFPHMVYKYHEHDSLLESKSEEELSEQEKNDAWAAYEADVKRKNETNMGPYNSNFGMLPNYSAGLGYANSLFNSYNNLSGVSGLNYPYNMYGQYNPYSSDYNQMRFSDYSAFYNNLMNVAGTSMSNYNQSNSNLLSSSHSSSVSSPPPSLLNSFTPSRNWMQPNASTSSYANNLLSSFAQSASSSKTNNLSNYSSYLNSIYNALGTNNAPSSSSSAVSNPNANPSKTPPLPLPNSDFNPLAYLQSKHNATSAITGSTSPLASSSTASSAQQGPNALRNPMLTKELTLPRNPTTAKDVFNPIPTSVITKTTTSSTSAPMSSISSSAAGGSSSSSSMQTNDGNKQSSKSPDTIISSSVDKNSGIKLPKIPTETQITVKDVTTINNESRNSPDTTGHPAHSKNGDKANNGVSSTVSVSIDSTKKSSAKSTTSAASGSTNMGIVYPPAKPVQTASTSKSSPNPSSLLRPKANATKDKVPPATSSISTTSNALNKSNQPMPSIIRKPIQSNLSKTGDATSDAVTAITKNKELTVTPRNVAASAVKGLPKVPGVNNSITLSPIPPQSNTKFIGGGVSITPQSFSSSRTLTSNSKPNASSPVPVSITKSPLNQTSSSKSPVTVAKPNVLSSRNINTNKVIGQQNSKTASPSSSISTAHGTRILNNSPSVSPKIVQRAAPSTTTKPLIVAQTKAQILASQMTKATANSSTMQINQVGVTKPRPVDRTPSIRPRIVTNKTNPVIIDSRKRQATETISIPAKRPKQATATSNLIAASSSASGSSKQHNSLHGIHAISKSASQQVNSQNSSIPVVDIVELD